jgi:hypothetical protein
VARDLLERASRVAQMGGEAMKLTWQIEPGDVAKVRSFLDLYRDDPFVQHRIQRNLREEKPRVS